MTYQPCNYASDSSLKQSLNLLCRLEDGVLGAGEFGTVNKGVWQSPVGAMEVAVKQLRPGATEEEKIKFLQEAAINGQFRHPNVVKLMGVVTRGEPVSA